MLDRPEVTQNASRLAQALGLSVRTLHRQLQQEGTSVQALKAQVRQERALALLERSTLALKQIAAEIGYRNEKSLIRAFKQWTGQSPAAWRRQRQPGAAA
jgi:AraC-like DNA-binding protein